MLTGDKGETAHTIAISCGLIDDKYDRVFTIDNLEKNEISASIQIIKEEISKMGKKDDAVIVINDAIMLEPENEYYQIQKDKFLESKN